MKKGIHPKLYKNAKVTDLSSSSSFNIPSTKKEITVEVTNLTHPYYTGKYRIVDTENLVKKFEERSVAANQSKVSNKKEKKLRRRSKTTSMQSEKAVTLKDLLASRK